jgi:Cof subfamily protein (haloacid dehalogenase superfamily)
LNIKLLVLDIDGTIAGQSNQVSKTVCEILQKVQEKGIKIALATGRMYRSALRFHQIIQSQLPIIAYNGAWIQDPFTNTIYQHLPLNSDIAASLLDYYEQPQWRSHLEVNFYIDDQLYVRQITSEIKYYQKRSRIEPIVVGDLRKLLTLSTTKVLVMAQDTKILQQLNQNLQQDYSPEQVYLTQSTPFYLEATHPQVNKGSATQYLTEKILGLQAENVMAIGDNFNDVQMIKYAGFGVAMGNAPTAVQNIADWVAPDVELEGVAVTVAKFLL